MPSSDKPSKNTSYSVSSNGDKRGKTVSFTVPRMYRPSFSVKGKMSKLLIIIVAILLVGLAGGYAGGWLEVQQNGDTVTEASLGHQKEIVSSDSQLINQIAKAVGPSVVSVNVSITSSSSSGFGLFGFSQPEQEQAAGTGIILNSDGLVITNRHVVPSGTTNVSVTLSDGTELKDVSVIGRTSSNDSLDI
ncbi:MAG: hypothetical protein ACREHG_07465, partial [Candidatus Saccharimonadales bacterium]